MTRPAIQKEPDEQITILEWNAAVKDATGLDAPSWGTTVMDAATMGVMARRLGLRGQAYLKPGAGGRTYIIIKHWAGSRPHLPGTRYLATNPKVSSFILTNRQAGMSALKSTRILVVAYVAINVVEELMSDRIVMSRLFGRLGVDVAKVAIAAGIGWLAGVAAGVLFAPALAPVAVAFVVGLAVGWGLDKIDERYRLTEKTIALLQRAETGIRATVHDLQLRAQTAMADVVDSARDAVVDAAERELRAAIDRLLRRYRPPLL